MKRLLLATVAFALMFPAPALARAPQPGRYRVSEGPDVAGGLEIGANGKFRYFLAAGALDEQAEGSWYREGAKICLRTEPKPVPAQFALAPAAPNQQSTLLVTWPSGEGIALVDFVIGFDGGDMLRGYTQRYGWSMPEGDNRTPRWIELGVRMYQLSSPRFELDGRKTIRAVLTPNDLGKVDFHGACLEARGNAFVLHRHDGDLRMVRAR